MVNRDILIAGKKRSGKNTVAEILMGYFPNHKVYGLADSIRSSLSKQDPIVGRSETGNNLRYNEVMAAFGDEAKELFPEIRRLMQATGQGFKELYGENFWCRQAPRGYGIVTDIRHKHEYWDYRSASYRTGKDLPVLIYVENPDEASDDLHISEDLSWVEYLPWSVEEEILPEVRFRRLSVGQDYRSDLYMIVNDKKHGLEDFRNVVSSLAPYLGGGW